MTIESINIYRLQLVKWNSVVLKIIRRFNQRCLINIKEELKKLFQAEDRWKSETSKKIINLNNECVSVLVVDFIIYRLFSLFHVWREISPLIHFYFLTTFIFSVFNSDTSQWYIFLCLSIIDILILISIIYFRSNHFIMAVFYPRVRLIISISILNFRSSRA